MSFLDHSFRLLSPPSSSLSFRFSHFHHISFSFLFNFIAFLISHFFLLPVFTLVSSSFLISSTHLPLISHFLYFIFSRHIPHLSLSLSLFLIFFSRWLPYLSLHPFFISVSCLLFISLSLSSSPFLLPLLHFSTPASSPHLLPLLINASFSSSPRPILFSFHCLSRLFHLLSLAASPSLTSLTVPHSFLRPLFPRPSSSSRPPQSLLEFSLPTALPRLLWTL